MTTDLFTPLSLADAEAPNRVMVSPMCQYSCDARDGLAILGRQHLRDPYFALHAARELDRVDDVEVPRQYWRGF